MASERFSTSGRRVCLSGHNASMASIVATLTGFELRESRVRGVGAKVGHGPDGPAVVLLPASATCTAMALSHEVDGLFRWANALGEVDEAEWLKRDGTSGLRILVALILRTQGRPKLGAHARG